jgi:hypothetical protein
MSKTDKKPTWMKIHSGLNKPKHRKAIGVRIWLFMYLIDNADWGTGRVDGFKDGDAAKELEMPKATIRKWRNGLQDAGYITSKPGFQCQNITIHKWRNPREVNPEQTNLKAECPKMDTHPTPKMDTHPLAKVDTPTIDHSNTESSTKKRKQDVIFNAVRDGAFGGANSPRVAMISNPLKKMGVKEEEVKGFFVWYKQKYRDASPPRDKTKFLEHYEEYRLSKNGKSPDVGKPAFVGPKETMLS